MRVLQFIASKVWGGAEKSFAELCNELSESMQVEVILFEENKIEERLNPDIKVHQLTSNSSRYNPFLYLEVLAIIKKVNPDIIHTHSAKASEIIYNVRKFFSAKHVATKRNPRKGRIFNKIDYVTAVSKDVVRSIDKQNVELIYNGLLREKTTLIKNSHSHFTLLAIGGLDKIKGFDILIEEVSKLDFPFHLSIVGEGVERENLEKLIEKFDLSDKVSLLGHREDIPSLIASASAVIISSHSEGFGRVLVETLFYGKLAVSTRVGLSMEILPEELLIDDFNIAEKINEIYKNEERYDTLFTQVQNTQTKKFLLESSVQKYIDFYEKILR